MITRKKNLISHKTFTAGTKIATLSKDKKSILRLNRNIFDSLIPVVVNSFSKGTASGAFASLYFGLNVNFNERRF